MTRGNQPAADLERPGTTAHFRRIEVLVEIDDAHPRQSIHPAYRRIHNSSEKGAKISRYQIDPLPGACSQYRSYLRVSAPLSMIPLRESKLSALKASLTGCCSSRFSHSPCGLENPFLSLRQAISGGRKGCIASRRQYLVQPLQSLYSSGVRSIRSMSRESRNGKRISRPIAIDMRSS